MDCYNIAKLLCHSKKGRCPEVCDKTKTRVSVTMTKPYLDGLDYLVEEGIYLGRGDAILEALRVFLREKGIEPFCPEAMEPV